MSWQAELDEDRRLLIDFLDKGYLMRRWSLHLVPQERPTYVRVPRFGKNWVDSPGMFEDGVAEFVRWVVALEPDRVVRGRVVPGRRIARHYALARTSEISACYGGRLFVSRNYYEPGSPWLTNC